jgi:hypothetical protein
MYTMLVHTMALRWPIVASVNPIPLKRQGGFSGLRPARSQPRDGHAYPNWSSHRRVPNYKRTRWSTGGRDVDVATRWVRLSPLQTKYSTLYCKYFVANSVGTCLPATDEHRCVIGALVYSTVQLSDRTSFNSVKQNENERREIGAHLP